MSGNKFFDFIFGPQKEDDIKVVEVGKQDQKDYKIYFTRKLSNNQIEIISPFHGINLGLKNDVVNMVVEIPKNRTEKLEINKDLDFNPLKYDIKDNKIREIKYTAFRSNIPGYPFNYGAIPQTWENPNKHDPRTGFVGDNDPLDAIDISEYSSPPGTIKKVKVLGAFAMIDNRETDWKIICIDINDSKAKNYNDIYDVPFGQIYMIEDFLRNYKTSEGKPQNEFYKTMIWDKNESIKIIKDLHDEWKHLMKTKESDIKLKKSKIYKK